MNDRDVIGYRRHLATALQSVLREALFDVKRHGIRSGHQLWISFRTPNVEMTDWLRTKYPAQMVIVLQHKFFIKAVTTDSFTVELMFSKIPISLTIPFTDIVSFNDPWADFGMAFEPWPAVGPTPRAAMAAPAPAPTPQGPADIINLNDHRRSP